MRSWTPWTHPPVTNFREESGDLLFPVANLARLLKQNPE